MKIRKKRTAGIPEDIRIIRRHRKNGPVIVSSGISGFLAGVTLVYIDKGVVIKYPYHLAVGTIIALSIIITFYISRKIRGKALQWRMRHFLFGLLIIALYLVQVFLGLNILF